MDVKIIAEGVPREVRVRLSGWRARGLPAALLNYFFNPLPHFSEATRHMVLRKMIEFSRELPSE